MAASCLYWRYRQVNAFIKRHELIRPGFHGCIYGWASERPGCEHMKLNKIWTIMTHSIEITECRQQKWKQYQGSLPANDRSANRSECEEQCEESSVRCASVFGRCIKRQDVHRERKHHDERAETQSYLRSKLPDCAAHH